MRIHHVVLIMCTLQRRAFSVCGPRSRHHFPPREPFNKIKYIFSPNSRGLWLFILYIYVYVEEMPPYTYTMRMSVHGPLAPFLVVVPAAVSSPLAERDVLYLCYIYIVVRAAVQLIRLVYWETAAMYSCTLPKSNLPPVTATTNRLYHINRRRSL